MHFYDSLHGRCLKSTNQAPRNQRKAILGYLPNQLSQCIQQTEALCVVCLALYCIPLRRASAHKIDLGEIIQFHFAFSCFGTLPAATSVLPEVRELWTRQSPAVVNGTPYSLYEFPVNLQITSNTIALHLDNVLCLHVYLLPIFDYLVGCRQLSLEPLWAPVSERVWVDGDMGARRGTAASDLQQPG